MLPQGSRQLALWLLCFSGEGLPVGGTIFRFFIIFYEFS
jgi:hypothetical protein